MALHLWNVRTRRKEPFVPLRQSGPVGMYVCGLTVYDHMHIGHARTAVSFEVVRRWLEHRFPGRLRFVQNVTDVDDKILARAKELGISPREHAQRWDEHSRRQVERLGLRPPDEAPHVTQSIPGIIDFIQGIVSNGFAYATPLGNVYFDVPRYEAHAQAAFPACAYGSLSNRDYREMAAGTRKDVESDKRHPADFALWKAGEPEDHPEANWPSPWARGRPGWHIECSLMATRSLGDRIDLHGGGQDLIFPHHENEVAQSQAKTGAAPFVNFWMHTGFLNVEGEKMSKSLGNFITLEGSLDELAVKGTDPAALRLYFVQTHYRSKIDYSRKGMEEAATALERLERTRRLLSEGAAHKGLGCADLDVPMREAAQRLDAAFAAAMDDDVHTPSALAALFEFQREANRILDARRPDASLGPGAAAAALAALQRCGQSLTLFDRPVAASGSSGTLAGPDAAAVKGDTAIVVPSAAGPVTVLVQDATLEQLRALAAAPGAADPEAAIRVLVAARQAARAGKDWKRSDAIRDAAKAAGYVIEDTPTGQRWSRA